MTVERICLVNQNIRTAHPCKDPDADDATAGIEGRAMAKGMRNDLGPECPNEFCSKEDPIFHTHD
jgi:hypothetical protein